MPGYISDLDNVASLLERNGLRKYAASVDEISNFLEEAQSSIELSKGSAQNKPLGDPSFTKVGELVKDQVHSNKDSAILKNLGHFFVDNKANTLSMIKKINTLVGLGTELHQGDIEFLHELQNILSE